MAFLTVDKDGTERIWERCPKRSKNFKMWETGDMLFHSFVCLPTGTIKKLIGYELSWEDEPFELKFFKDSDFSNHKVLEITYYHSNIIEEMLFDSEEDAEYFDETLKEYISTFEAICEFKSPKFPSVKAIENAIYDGTFAEQLNGEYSEKLIEASERMVDGYNGATVDDCYLLPLLYVFNKVYNNK